MLKLEPLFSLVTVKTTEKTPFGEVVCRARNPVAYKALMSILGMPAGGCRQPLGKLTRNGVDVVLEAARKVHATAPDILQPVADFFNVDIGQRLENPENWEGLYYENY
jgi:4-hydroxy-tetrahydrodipicolinate synthase